LIHSRFLPCEQQVMLLATAGKMNKQIAGDLGGLQ
jgi:FixJ family two-component response regulator